MAEYYEKHGGGDHHQRVTIVQELIYENCDGLTASLLWGIFDAGFFGWDSPVNGKYWQTMGQYRRLYEFNSIEEQRKELTETSAIYRIVLFGIQLVFLVQTEFCSFKTRSKYHQLWEIYRPPRTKIGLSAPSSHSHFPHFCSHQQQPQAL